MADEHLATLLRDLVEEASRLVRLEIASARSTVKQRVKRSGAGLGLFVAAGVAAALGTACLVASAVLGLANGLRPWFAALVGGTVLLLLALLVVAPGWHGVRDQMREVPADARASLRDDLAAVRDAIRR